MIALIFSLPAGSEVWKDTGGWEALSAEEFRLLQLDEHLVMIAHAFSGDKGRGPQPSSAPIGRIQQRMIDTRRKQTYTSKATKAKQRVEANREKDMQKLAQYWGDWHTAPSKWDVMREQASKGLAQWDNESTEKPEETTE